MLKLSLRNRIAFYYIVSTGLLILLVFFVIHSSVKVALYSELDRDIAIELDDLLTEITIGPDGFRLSDPEEWLEKEHITLNVNPIYIQFNDKNGELQEKSPNLDDNVLAIKKPHITNFYNSSSGTTQVRQKQLAIKHNGNTVGYLIVAVPVGDATAALNNLFKIMLISYPLILLVLYMLASFFAGKSIKPVQAVIETSERITRDNLGERIPLPNNKDELYKLAETINGLLNRIESAVEREKQFTSDASHELRTPLSVIKGTLEVLIRKPREKEEYEQKIEYCIQEVNRINHLVDQLLLLARFENQKMSIEKENVYLNTIVHDAVIRNSAKLKANEITVAKLPESDHYAYTDSYLISIIIDNIISNAAKYAGKGTTLNLKFEDTATGKKLIISDNGKGINSEDLEKIYGRFYRAKNNDESAKGTGLGLSIVKKLCDLLNISISIESTEGQGTTVTLVIP